MIRLYNIKKNLAKWQEVEPHLKTLDVVALCTNLQVIGTNHFDRFGVLAWADMLRVPEADMMEVRKAFGDLLKYEVCDILESPEDVASEVVKDAVAALKELKSDMSSLFGGHTKITNLTLVAGSDLHRYNHVKVMEDACTEEIDNMLVGGWRIVHVWKDYEKHRRPSYIMGKVESVA